MPGPNSIDLPFDSTFRDEGQLGELVQGFYPTAGAVVMAAAIDIDEDPTPALVFRMPHAISGEFALPPVVLIQDEKHMREFSKLVHDATRAAIKEANERKHKKG